MSYIKGVEPQFKGVVRTKYEKKESGKRKCRGGVGDVRRPETSERTVPSKVTLYLVV